ncbi:MAG: hypothetical protein R6T92_11685, partial [Desulfosalsimonadaceae bacterium]
GPVVGHREHAGFNTGLSVWLDAPLVEDITCSDWRAFIVFPLLFLCGEGVSFIQVIPAYTGLYWLMLAPFRVPRSVAYILNNKKDLTAVDHGREITVRSDSLRLGDEVHQFVPGECF